ncbi:MAG: type IV pilus secretin PilQ [Desulfobacula sp.]|jgi:type IV pilus assembly protein PilQ
MFFPPTKRLKNMMVNILSFLFTIFLLAGCFAQKTENTKTAEQDQAKSTTAETRSDIQNDRQISAVNVDVVEQEIIVKVMGNQKLVYTSIKQSFPFGIAVYLPETKISHDFKNNVKENEFISNVLVNYADKEMTTAKIEILLIKDLDYKVIETENILKFTLSQPMGGKDQIKNKTEPLLNAEENKPVIKTREKNNEVRIPKQTATLTNIKFDSMEDGKSSIVVETNHPVKYDITMGGKEKLFLNLYNTIIPDNHKRPLLTQYFKSAVESLMPVQVPGKQNNSKIEINIRDLVPYRVVQDQNTILMYFEPTLLDPPVFAKAKKTASGNVQTETIDTKKKESALQENQSELAKKNKTLEEEIYGPKKKYTGEKIKLDFYETDIKNVFRILRSVGGLNFAIDKDVEGKVTLALEDPVPWDQVLDLILKMNNLGQKKEGNVIRIATLDTIRKEEKLLQEAFTEKKKSLDDKESLEPVVTEYIPINYSDAEADIKPHIEQILTKERGRISVDKRTNMIIITDIQPKIDQAKETIYRLDRVTPQIMIEAKVVEVTKNFTRELGLGLSFSKTQTAWTGRDRDFGVALNYPTATPVNTGAFNFYNILGSDFLNLQAQIRASETKGDVKVISSPRILTLDNKKAKIKQGLEFAYLERDTTGGSSVKFKNIDLLLEVTPHVTPDKRISMTVYLTKNDIDSVTNGVPSLATNEAQTELLVNDNDTIVIGGIVKTTDNKSNSGTPGLSEIPILGRLFKTNSNTDNRNELLIFLTPSIIQLEQKRSKTTAAD